MTYWSKGEAMAKKITLGEYVRRHRKETGLSYMELEEKTEVSRTTIWRVAREQRYDLETFSKLCKYLKIGDKEVSMLLED